MKASLTWKLLRFWCILVYFGAKIDLADEKGKVPIQVQIAKSRNLRNVVELFAYEKGMYYEGLKHGKEEEQSIRKARASEW